MSQRKRIGRILDVRSRARPVTLPAASSAEGPTDLPLRSPEGPLGWDVSRQPRRWEAVCRTCQREIGPGCRRRQVVHLRGLIALRIEEPSQCRLAGHRGRWLAAVAEHPLETHAWFLVEDHGYFLAVPLEINTRQWSQICANSSPQKPVDAVSCPLL